jgi:hypothetical protein
MVMQTDNCVRSGSCRVGDLRCSYTALGVSDIVLVAVVSTSEADPPEEAGFLESWITVAVAHSGAVPSGLLVLSVGRSSFADTRQLCADVEGSSQGVGDPDEGFCGQRERAGHGANPAWCANRLESGVLPEIVLFWTPGWWHWLRCSFDRTIR